VNWNEFFAMGGYALYVWGSYLLAALVLVLNVWVPLRQRMAVLRNLGDFYRLKGQQE
jgi:heme exporter protein D